MDALRRERNSFCFPKTRERGRNQSSGLIPRGKPTYGVSPIGFYLHKLCCLNSDFSLPENQRKAASGTKQKNFFSCKKFFSLKSPTGRFQIHFSKMCLRHRDSALCGERPGAPRPWTCAKGTKSLWKPYIRGKASAIFQFPPRVQGLHSKLAFAADIFPRGCICVQNGRKRIAVRIRLSLHGLCYHIANS